MRTQSRSVSRRSRPVIDEAYFERKARSLVVADEEIEAWELETDDLSELAGQQRDYLDLADSE
jgi:hypothetical protein